VPVTQTSNGIIIKGLAPGFLEWSRSIIYTRLLHQHRSAGTGLQETGIARLCRTKTYDPNNLPAAIQCWSATITMLNIATDLNNRRSSIRGFNRTDENLVYRRGEQLRDVIHVHIAITGETNYPQLVLFLQVVESPMGTTGMSFILLT